MELVKKAKTAQVCTFPACQEQERLQLVWKLSENCRRKIISLSTSISMRWVWAIRIWYTPFFARRLLADAWIHRAVHSSLTNSLSLKIKRRLFESTSQSQDSRTLCSTKLTKLQNEWEWYSSMNWMLLSQPNKRCCTTCSTGHVTKTQSCCSSQLPTQWTCPKDYRQKFKVGWVTTVLFTSLTPQHKSKPFFSQGSRTWKSSTKRVFSLSPRKFQFTLATSEGFCK